MATDQDKQIGLQATILRGDKTQQAVAAGMRARGWKWSQATVWSIEKGDRPLRLAEAADLSDVLGVPDMDLLLARPQDAEVRKAAQATNDAYDAIVESVLHYLGAENSLKVILDNASKTGVELMHEDSLLHETLKTHSDYPEQAVAQARHRLLALEGARERMHERQRKIDAGEIPMK